MSEAKKLFDVGVADNCFIFRCMKNGIKLKKTTGKTTGFGRQKAQNSKWFHKHLHNRLNLIRYSLQGGYMKHPAAQCA